MTAINTRLNGQSSYPASHSKAAWREEMLGEFLSKMREHKLPKEVVKPTPALPKNMRKGSYVDLYV